MNDARRAEIRRQYRVWRAAVDLSQAGVEDAARKIYPEFGAGRFWKIENGLEFPTPTEKKALASVLGVSEDDLPAPAADDNDEQHAEAARATA